MNEGKDDHSSSESAPLTDAEYEQLALRCEDMELDAVWGELNSPFAGADWMARFRSFDVRKHAFLWIIRRLVLDGHIVLVVADGRPEVALPGTLDEQIEAMSSAFPRTDDEMENGIWFFMPACPFGGNWRHGG